MPLISMFGPVQEEAVRIFYANFFDINNKENSFWTTISGVPLQISPTIISRFLGVPRPTQALITFPIHKLTLEQKGARVKRLCGRFLNLLEKLLHKDYRPIAQVHQFFTYNILPTTNRSILLDDIAYMIDAILDSQRIDLPTLICYMMISAHKATHSTGSLPYPTLVIMIM